MSFTPIENCERCPRLRHYCHAVAAEKRKSFRDDKYWGRPVPHFGDPAARLLIVGLAPAAHGGNRTGRMFTGDRSGEWLYRALSEYGFANQYSYLQANDGLQLHNALITAVVHCAPPQNKPSRDEIENCRPYLLEVLQMLPWKVILCLGQLAWDEVQKLTREGELKKHKFAHGAQLALSDGKKIIASFHPSQQNTFTKKLTKPMFDAIFEEIQTHLK